jgi:hypothetical protein
VTVPLAAFTAEQETRLAAIEAAPHDEASAVERVARAMWEAAMKGRDDAAQAVTRVEELIHLHEDRYRETYVAVADLRAAITKSTERK